MCNSDHSRRLKPVFLYYAYAHGYCDSFAIGNGHLSKTRTGNDHFNGGCVIVEGNAVRNCRRPTTRFTARIRLGLMPSQNMPFSFPNKKTHARVTHRTE
jgi:hypothetical protein